ncbi:MAG: hypothetical protein ACPGVU_09840, partial [Limisphaerales bacterium]
MSLSEWLWRLVDTDSKICRRAGEALGGMYVGLPTASTSFAEVAGDIIDVKRQQLRFESAIREVMRNPEFDVSRFLRTLVTCRLALDERWLRSQKPTRPHAAQDSTNKWGHQFPILVADTVDPDARCDELA